MRVDQKTWWQGAAVAVTGVMLASAAAWAQEEDTPAQAEAAITEDVIADDAALAEDIVTDDLGDEASEGAPEGETTDELSDEATAEDAETTDAPQEEELLEEDTARDWGRLQPVANLIDRGGAVIIILIILSIISLMVIVVKLIQFRTLRVGDHHFTSKISDLLADGQDKKALSMLESRRGVIARVMETALRGKMLGGNDEAARQETERVAKAKLDGLEQGLPLLNLIATVSPLIGLLGTVLGMIDAFQQLENAGDRVDPAILSGGIWEALLTTAAGLTVAIPAAAFFTWLQRSVDVAAQHMEDAAIRVFTSSLYSQGHTTSDDDA